jgi:hypothetical protein
MHVATNLHSDSTTELKAYLEHLSLKVVLAHRDIEAPGSIELLRSTLAPNLMVSRGDGHCSSSINITRTHELRPRQQHITAALAGRRRWPDWSMEVYDIVTELQDDGRKAEVWLTLVGNFPVDNTQRSGEVVQKLTWVRRAREQRWVWQRLASLYNVAVAFVV